MNDVATSERDLDWISAELAGFAVAPA